ncbi:hypothetical protein [Baekduia sp.]|uniref:hypothetical protein n=1 Tax=Baekduia sp. TaxID=2600305 RepID=UPI002D1FA49A|nr:hypothetical protein [Baekduia sp.]
MPGPRPSRQPLLALLAATSLVAGILVVPAAAGASAKPASAAAKQRERERRSLRAQAAKQPTITLKSSFIRRAQAASSVLPFTLRLRRPYEGGPGDDAVSLAWDPSATPWPLPGTAPAPTPAVTNLDGALTYQWDYGADTSGYATLGTVETHIGGGVSLVGTGFPMATPEGSTCTSLASLSATGISLTAAGARFGTVNPFSGEVNGTISLRTTIRTKAVPCSGTLTPETAVATTTGADPPLPVAFSGRFTVSPSVMADGRVRFGVLRIFDTPSTPQRSTFGLMHACTDPTAADGCARRAFPVRTKVLSMVADVLAGDAMPGPPPAPPEPAAPLPAPEPTPPDPAPAAPAGP